MLSKIGNGNEKKSSHQTIFDEVLASDLPEQEKDLDRLGDEAQTVMGAGLVTTAWSLAHATFYILNEPIVLQKLRTELFNAIPDLRAPLDWTKLEELPYLTGCIKEGIRLSYCVSARNPRISPQEPIKYKDWEIPPGTPVSMTVVDVHQDADVYPEPHRFIPERWIDPAKMKNGSRLDRYFVAFGKGPRQCLGIKYVPSATVEILLRNPSQSCPCGIVPGYREHLPPI